MGRGGGAPPTRTQGVGVDPHVQGFSFRVPAQPCPPTSPSPPPAPDQPWLNTRSGAVDVTTAQATLGTATGALLGIEELGHGVHAGGRLRRCGGRRQRGMGGGEEAGLSGPLWLRSRGHFPSGQP